MFMTELKFPADCLNHFFEKEIEIQHLELSQERKLD